MWQNCSMKVAPSNLNIKTKTITATCPACGLLCDDILVENNNNKINVLTKGCVKAVRFFEQPLNEATPLINGKSASLQQAIAHAARLIKASQQPLFAGLSSDVAGFRSIYNLAQVTNGNLQHINAQSMSRNMKVLQSTGWQTTTLGEVKNRADVIVCFGDVATHNPRFFERFVDVDGMFVTAKKRQIIMFNDAENKDIIKGDALEAAWILALRAADMPSVTIALRALVAGKVLKATEIAAIKISDLQAVADKLKAAKYAVLAWVAKDLDFPHAELTIQNITETVAILNQTTRAAGLPLGGSDCDTSANNAHTWLNGKVLADLGATNSPSSKPDLQIWVNSFNPDAPPSVCHTPTIILGHANTPWAAHADVFIPVATPGLDCGGTLFRVDSAVILPLKKVRGANNQNHALPTLREVVSGIEKLL
jgi:formylmethanofuran dehydrogenase subunit B